MVFVTGILAGTKPGCRSCGVCVCILLVLETLPPPPTELCFFLAAVVSTTSLFVSTAWLATLNLVCLVESIPELNIYNWRVIFNIDLLKVFTELAAVIFVD